MDGGSVEFEFLTREPSLHGIFEQQVLLDAASAHLSTSMCLYYLLRPYIPMSLRRLLQRSRSAGRAEEWCFPKAFMQRLIQGIAANEKSSPMIHPWPDPFPYSFVLTHDVETQRGVGLIEKVAAVEEDLGFRSSWNIVPFKYKVDPGLRRDLVSRGFEIGVHGYSHDGMLYWSRKVFSQRARAINGVLNEYQSVGFRSPMVHRNLEWLQELNIDYEASCFDLDLLQPMPGGVGTIWPFIAGKFVELPYTMPQDHSLFVALGQTDDSVWRKKLEFVAGNHGMAMMLTHPDYLDTPRLLNIYRDFLVSVKERGDCWHALPREVSAWWRKRSQSRIERAADGAYEIQGPASGCGRVVALKTDGQRIRLELLDDTAPAKTKAPPHVVVA